MPDLTGKVAVVTGSTKGIGRAIARTLARAGAGVVVSSRTPADVDETAAALAEETGARVLGIPCDVRDPESCQRLMDMAAEELGRIDILVNNAGHGYFAPADEMSVEDFRAQIETNLCGPFYCMHAAVRWLKASGEAWIVNIGSLAGRNPIAGGAAYNASKYGLIGMTEAMMLDLRYHGIRVSVVMPGSVNTAFRGKDASPGRDWRLEAEDVAETVLGMLGMPPSAHVSRVEMRPSRPPK